MAAEIERKFVLRHSPVLTEERHAGRRIIQGYVTLDANGTELRVRQLGDQSYLTVKSGKGMVRTEVEMEISAERFAELWTLTAGRCIEKVRHTLTWDGRTVEIDVYDGHLAGHVVAEVEFPSEAAAEGYLLPESWKATEVTQDGRFKNQSLAVMGWPA